MNIMLLGPPGAGKGTQAEYIASLLDIPHISTGDAFRLAMREQTQLGMQAKQYVEAGKLVPDDITIGIVRQRLEKEDCASGFLLDGFPRTILQAEAFDEWLSSRDTQLHHVIRLHVDPLVLMDRLTGRIVCRSCGATYHVKHHPTRVVGVCDKCGGEVVQRSDDDPAKVHVRLAEYEQKTAPLIAYYEQKGFLRTIDGTGSKDDVTRQLSALLVCET